MTQTTGDRRLERLVQRLYPHSKLLRAWELAGGISAQTTALEALLADGRQEKIIARWPGNGAAEREFRTLQAVRAAGIAAPAPLLLDVAGDPCSGPAILIEYIEGKPDYAPADPAGFVAQMAEQLAAIHRLSGSHPSLSLLTPQTERLSRQLARRSARLDGSLDEGRIRAALEAAWPLPQPAEPALLHGDFWPGNILWREGRIAGVVDWEDAEIGHPLGDLAVTRLDLLWTCGVEAMHVFTRHYQALTGADLSDLPYWDLIAALRPAGRLVEWAAIWPKFGREDITTKTMTEGHRFFVAQAFEGLARRG